MAIRIIARRMSSGGYRHDHIVMLQWLENGVGFPQESTREVMVDWVGKGGQAYTQDEKGIAYLKVVHAVPPYVQTYADNRQSDNLLRLPTF